MALTAPLGVQVIRGHKETDSRFVLCLWFVHDVFMVYSRFVHGLFYVGDSSWFVYGLFTVCSCKILFTFCSMRCMMGASIKRGKQHGRKNRHPKTRPASAATSGACQYIRRGET